MKIITSKHFSAILALLVFALPGCSDQTTILVPAADIAVFPQTAPSLRARS